MLTVHIKKQLSHYTLDVQFRVGKEVLVLFGPSGSGKTTILNSIAGLTKIDYGEIILNNRILCRNGKSLLPVQKRKVGYLFQDYALFPHKTVWENIAYGMKRKNFVRQLMRDLHMEHLQNHYPHEISGGEKQRTALIRSLATEPELLLLDEPFSALDEQTKKNSYQQLLDIQQRWQIPIILVTHNTMEVETLANKVFYIEDGKFTEEKRNESLYNTFSFRNLLTDS